MNSRERVLTTLDHKEPDRIPFDLGGARSCGINVIAYKKLIDYLGIDLEAKVNNESGFFAPQLAKVDEMIYKKLGVDVRPLFVSTPVNWSLEIHEEEDHYWYLDEWHRKLKMPKKSYYYNRITFPLQDKDLDDYEWPDYSDPKIFKETINRAKDYSKDNVALVFPRPPGNGFLQMGARLYGYENWMMMLGTNPKEVEKFMNKYLEFKINFWSILLDNVGNDLDVVCELDDLGTQRSQWISLDMYKKFIKPYQKKLFSFIKKKADVKIFFHTDGSIKKFIPHLIEVGVDILNPLQYSAEGINPKEIKKEFGNDLVIWGGGLDTQKILPRGTKQEIYDEVEKRINDLAPGGGFVFSAIHHIQPDVPPANIIYMIEALRLFGSY